MHPPHSAHALCVGPFVSRALRQSPLSVMAVFARTVYAQNSAGEILCLAGADLPLGPFTVVCNPWQAISDASLEVGDLLQMHNQTITGPRGLCIRMNQAARWSPPLPALGSMGQRTAGVERALALAPALAPQEGLAPLLLQLDAGQRPKSEDPFTEALRAAGREGLESLWRWLQTSRKDDLEDAAKRLLGLGPGLTPSGDDVLGGVFLALYALSLPDAIHALKEVLDERGEKATNHISLAYLKAAGENCGSSVLHEALAAVCADSPGLERALQGLGRMGHSSGWDAFLGLILALRRHNGSAQTRLFAE